MDTGQVDQSRPWMAVGQEITDILQRIDPASFFAVAEVFADAARRWFFSGQGRSGLAAQMAAMRFMHMGRQVHFVGEATAPSIRKGDGLLIVSGSGETAVSVNYGRIASSEGADCSLITNRTETRSRGEISGFSPKQSQVRMDESI